MKKIIIHWTAGTNYPCTTDFEHYHYLVDKDGKVYEGKLKPEDNENCYDGKYVAHTGGGNTASIGVSLCGMANFDLKTKSTKYPLTFKQFEESCKLIANLCRKYKIVVSKENVMTHYEFGLKNPKTSSFGKIDITFLPFYNRLKVSEIGDFFRQKISSFL